MMGRRAKPRTGMRQAKYERTGNDDGKIDKGTYDRRNATINKHKELRGGVLDIPENFEFLTPMARTLAIAQCAAPDYMIDEFCDLRAQMNILRAVQVSLRSVASGIS